MSGMGGGLLWRMWRRGDDEDGAGVDAPPSFAALLGRQAHPSAPPRADATADPDLDAPTDHPGEGPPDHRPEFGPELGPELLPDAGAEGRSPGDAAARPAPSIAQGRAGDMPRSRAEDARDADPGAGQPGPSKIGPIKIGTSQIGASQIGRRRGGGGLAVLVGAVFLCVAVELVMSWTTNRALELYALRRVESWRAVMVDAMPDLPQALQSGAIGPRDSARLISAGDLADAFGFRLFSAYGAPVAYYSAWAGQTEAGAIGHSPADPAPEQTRLSPRAAGADPDRPRRGRGWRGGAAASPLPAETHPHDPSRVLQTQHPDAWAALRRNERKVELEVNSDDPGRPARYAEVFVPISDPRGQTMGYAEVYLDLTRFANGLSRLLFLTGTALAAATALAFAGPALAWLATRRRNVAAEARIRHIAQRDQLTNLPNRAGFAAEAARLAANAARDGASLAVLCVDVDRFRMINDLHGAKTGDTVLRHAAATLRASLRAGDLLARIGPDDFAAVVRLDRDVDLVELLGMISQRASAPSPGPDGRALSVTVSIGACALSGGEVGIDGALRRAEIALQEARGRGDGRMRVFEPEMEIRLHRRRRIERAIREGMQAGRFSLHYQPLVRAGDGQTRGFEALMRLRDARGEALSPGEFIPAAEGMDLIVPLGAWALHEATSVAAGWPAPLSVSVNLSVVQFRDGGLVDTVRSALAASGLDPRRLELEVTESLLISDAEGVSRQLEQLKAMSVSLAMDDFGTGYSSLAYLWRYRFDRLKLDRSFLLAFDQNPTRARSMISAIVALGRRLGMKVTAEGVETEAQADAMAELGCDNLQGYRFGAPMTEAQLREVMRWESDADAETQEAKTRPSPRDFAAAADAPWTRRPADELACRQEAETEADPAYMAGADTEEVALGDGDTEDADSEEWDPDDLPSGAAPARHRA